MAKNQNPEWEHLGHTGAGKNGNYDGTIINHWRDPSTGAEYVMVEGKDAHQWYKIEGTTLKKLSSEPTGFNPPAKKK